MSFARRPWLPRTAVLGARSRLAAISKGAGIAALVLFVVTGAAVAGIIGSNQRRGMTPVAAAGPPSSSSVAATLDPVPTTSTGLVGVTLATLPPVSSGAPAVVAIAQPKSQGQPGIVPVPLAPRATAGPIPLLAWEAYHLAAAGSGCNLPWYVLAGIGKIESNHGRYGGAQFDVTGTVHPSIFGPPTAYGRAMGPMQFIPPTWASYAADGNDDDITNPQNIFDATKAAAHYLCQAGGPDLSGLAAQRRAVFAYNHLASYVADVLAFATAYQHGEPEKVVHLLPIVYPKPATKAVATKAGATTSSAASGHTSATSPPTSTRTATSASPTTAPSTTTTSTTTPSTTTTPSASPTTSTCATASASPTSASRTTSAVSATTAAVPAMTSGSTSAVPTRSTAARSDSTTSPSSTPTTCPPCPTVPPSSTPASSSTPTSASATATACPTTVAPTTTASEAKSTARLTPRS